MHLSTLTIFVCMWLNIVRAHPFFNNLQAISASQHSFSDHKSPIQSPSALSGASLIHRDNELLTPVTGLNIKNSQPMVGVSENKQILPTVTNNHDGSLRKIEINKNMESNLITSPPQNSIVFDGRNKRRTQHIVTDCIEVRSDEGEYFHKADVNWEEGKACGLYLFAEPDQRIEIYFTYLDVPCENGGLVSYIDGWELNGEFFPSVTDHAKTLDERFAEFCGQRKVKQVFVSSQNAALIQYRMPARKHGFSVNVRFIKNPSPCNILLQDTDDVYTLRNYNKRVNCSLSALFSAGIRVVALNVGLSSGGRNLEIETGTLHKCNKRGLEDYVEIGGSDGLDNTNLQLVETICGLNSKPDILRHKIFCGTTTIRLVSSGLFDNSITVSIRKVNEDDIMDASIICGL